MYIVCIVVPVVQIILLILICPYVRNRICVKYHDVNCYASFRDCDPILNLITSFDINILKIFFIKLFKYIGVRGHLTGNR